MTDGYVDTYCAWLKLKYTQVTHNSAIGRALAYSINQEEYLRMFLTDGKIPMDNNYAELAIHPFTIARKNFVLMEPDHGVKASAKIFSIAETDKAINLNTYAYFELILSKILKHQDDKNLDFIKNFSTGQSRFRRNVLAGIKKLN